jgi:serine/threonine-protein kinase
MLVDPLSAWTHFLAATTFRLLRRYDEALAASNAAVELNPRHGRARSGRGQVLLLRGDLDGALDDAERAVALTEQSPLAVMTLGAAHAARGDRERAEACLDGMLRRHDSERPAATAIGLALAALGRRAEAVHWLQEAAVAREPWATWLGAEPFADPLRGDPRFQALLRRMGVPGS